MKRTIPSRLSQCSNVHAGVSSSDLHKRSYIRPFSFNVPAEVAWKALRQLVIDWPRTDVISDVPGYLKVLTHSMLLRLPDEVEFLLDTHQTCIYVCSVSKVLPYDCGSNRRRLEKIRIALTEQLSKYATTA